MSSLTWVAVSVGIVVLAGLVLALLYYKQKKMKKEECKTDYYALFVLGICFLPIGTGTALALGNPGMMGMTALGVIYMAMGLSHREEWKNCRSYRKGKKK